MLYTTSNLFAYLTYMYVHIRTYTYIVFKYIQRNLFMKDSVDVTCVDACKVKLTVNYCIPSNYNVTPRLATIISF